MSAPLIPWAQASVEERRRRDAIVRYAGAPGHVESFFLKANDPRGPRAVWLKFTILAPASGGAHVAEVWAIVFDRETGRHQAFKESFDVRDAQLGRERLKLRAGKNRLEPGWTRGDLRAPGGGSVAWDLTFDEGLPPLRLLPSERLYTSKRFPRTKATTPHPACQFRGEIRSDAGITAVDNWPGMLGHNWGREHAWRYAWAHCSAFPGHPGTFFEGTSARVRIGPVPLPFLTLLYLHHEGRAYDFRGVRHWLNRSVEVGLYRWCFRARSRDVVLEGEVTAEARDMVGLVYEDPTGASACCLNTKVGAMRLRLLRPGGSEIATLETADKAALELLVREREHGVQMHV